MNRPYPAFRGTTTKLKRNPARSGTDGLFAKPLVKVTKTMTPCQGPKGTCLPSLLSFIFKAEAWPGHGDGDAICESTGLDFRFHRRNRGFPQRKAEGLQPRRVPWNDHRLVVSRSAALSSCPAGTSKCSPPLCFLKSEGGQAKRQLWKEGGFWYTSLVLADLFACPNSNFS